MESQININLLKQAQQTKEIFRSRKLQSKFLSPVHQNEDQSKILKNKNSIK